MIVRISLLFFLNWIILSLVAAFPLVVQKGSITGTVVNSQTQEPLPGANVLLQGTGLGSSTDADGVFFIQGVNPGTYIVRVSLLGFEQRIITDVVVNPAKPAILSIELQETKIEFEGVDVSAGYFRETPETPVSTQEQSAEEIRRLPGGQEDVVRAISILPGVAQVQAGRNDLIVRGGAPSENLYLIDNLEVPNINHFGTQGASGGPLSYVNLDFVDATSFSTGGFGVRFGDKLSSVLNIKLREGRTDRMGGKITLAASQFGANVEGPFSDRGTYLFSVRRSYLDFIFKAAGFGFVPEYWDVLAKATYRLNSSDQLSFIGIAALDRVKLFNDTPDQRLDNSRILVPVQDQFVNGVTWKHLFSSGYATATLGYRYNTYDYTQNDSLLNPIFTSETREWETSLLTDVVYKISSLSEISFGVQSRVSGFTTGVHLPAYLSSYGEVLAVDRTADTTGWKHALFAQWVQTMGHLQLTLGARYDYFSLIERSSAVAPRAALSYAVTRSVTLNASAGRYYQAPAALWLVANPVNKALEHISVDQVVTGVDFLLQPDVKLSLEGYLKSYDKYPVSRERPYLLMVNTGAGYGGSGEGFSSFGIDSLAGLGTGLTHGVELFLQKRLSEIPCYGTIGVSYNETRFQALDGIRRPGSFDQRWIINLGGGYVLNNEWEVSAKFRFAAGRPYTPFNPDGTQDPARYNSLRVEANHSLDIRADKRWSFERWSLIMYLDIQNVYNRKPADVPRFNTRTGQVEQGDAIGMLPSIGISAEF